jgi:hypothetical protein
MLPVRRSIAVVGGLATLFSMGVFLGKAAKPTVAPAASLAPAPVTKVRGVKVPSLPEPVAVVSLRPAPAQPSKSQTTIGTSTTTSTATTPGVGVQPTASNTVPAKTGGNGSSGSGEVISSGSGG